MDIINIPISKGFLIKVKHCFNYPSLLGNEFKIWNPIAAGNCEHHIYSNEPIFETEYYDYCNNGELIFTPLFFGKEYKNIPEAVFKKIIEYNFVDEDELLKFPFRDDSRAFYNNGEIAPISDDFIEKREEFSSVLDSFLNGSERALKYLNLNTNKTEQKAFLNGYLQETARDNLYNFELNKKWKRIEERDSDSEYKEWLLKEYQITVFDGWYSYAMWEMANKIGGDKSISKCIDCGNILTFRKGEHRDRKMCRKEDNLNCWRKQNSQRKARQRNKKSR